jgi:hypothetical protein
MATDYRLTSHAIEEMQRRQISRAMVDQVLAAPEQKIAVRPGRMVYQSRIEIGNPPKTYLVRVFVDVDRDPLEVVTVYRTSKLSKYWEAGQ